MKTCARGHTFRGDENYRARRGWCPVCFLETRRRYNQSEKGKATHQRYSQTLAAKDVKRRANARTNSRRIYAGEIYLGRCGFTITETEAMLDGSTD